VAEGAEGAEGAAEVCAERWILDLSPAVVEAGFRVVYMCNYNGIIKLKCLIRFIHFNILVV
jgi:hypothetical protein